MRRRLTGVCVGTLMALVAGASAVALHRSTPRPARAAASTAPAKLPPAPAPVRLTATGRAAAVPLAAPSGATFTDMTFLPGGQDGWVVGRSCPPATPERCGGFVYATTDGGRSWLPTYRGPIPLDQVFFADTRHGWAWGTSAASVRDCGVTGPCTTTLLATGDGGMSWAPIYQTAADARAIAFGSDQTGLMAIRRCADTVRPATCTGEILRSTDGGRMWRRVSRQPYPVVGVTFAAGRAWAVTSGMADSGMADSRNATADVLVSPDAGRTWRKAGTISLPLPPPATRADLLFTRQGVGWLSLFGPQSCGMHGCTTDAVYRSGDGGRTWKPVAVPFRTPSDQPCGPAGMPHLTATAGGGRLIAVRSKNFAACGPPESTLSVSSDRGASWQIRKAWDMFGADALSWPDADHGWVLGRDALLRTANGGRSWTQVLPPLHPTAAVDFLDGTHGWGVGSTADPGAVLASADGGRRWREVSSVPGVRLKAICFVDDRHGWVAGQPVLSGRTEAFATQDGGHTWTFVASLSGWSPFLHFTDAEHGIFFVVQGQAGAAVVTADGGQTWAAGMRSPVGHLLSGAAFPNAGQGWLLTVPPNVLQPGPPALLHTTDGGATWQKAALLPATHDRTGTGLSFASPRVGWLFQGEWKLVPIPGVNAAALKPIATLYETTDSGRSWAGMRLPADVGTPISLFALDRRSVWLLSGRPEVSGITLWRTSDGGKIWTQIAW